jgi:DNA-binding transcriptional LysR family regulator
MVAKSQDQVALRWEDVPVFLAAYRQGSLGAAAQRLQLDTSTVSRRLSAFEAALGQRLFERSREGLRASAAAERVYPAAEAVEAAYARLVREASGVEAAAEGVVRISVAPGMAEVFVAPLLAGLRAKHPRLDIELDASVSPRDLTRHEADLALRSLEPRGAELLVTKLVTARWVAAGSATTVQRLGRLQAWGAAPWLAWDRDLAAFGPARWLARHAARAAIPLRTSHFAAQLAAARAGLGILLVPEPYLQPAALVPVRYTAELAASAEDWPIDTLWLVGHRALRDVPRVAAAWDYLAREIRRAALLTHPAAKPPAEPAGSRRAARKRGG